MEINLVRDKLTLLLFARFLIYERMCARIVVNGYPPFRSSHAPTYDLVDHHGLDAVPAQASSWYHGGLA